MIRWFVGSLLDRRKDRQTDRQTDRPTDRQTDRQTDRRTDRQTDRRTDGQTDGRTNDLFIHLHNDWLGKQPDQPPYVWTGTEIFQTSESHPSSPTVPRLSPWILKIPGPLTTPTECCHASISILSFKAPFQQGRSGKACAGLSCSLQILVYFGHASNTPCHLKHGFTQISSVRAIQHLTTHDGLLPALNAFLSSCLPKDKKGQAQSSSLPTK